MENLFKVDSIEIIDLSQNYISKYYCKCIVMMLR